MNWQKLSMLHDRFIANCDALSVRDAALAKALREYVPACEYLIAADALATPAPDAPWDEVDELFFGRG